MSKKGAFISCFSVYANARAESVNTVLRLLFNISKKIEPNNLIQKEKMYIFTKRSNLTKIVKKQLTIN